MDRGCYGDEARHQLSPRSDGIPSDISPPRYRDVSCGLFLGRTGSAGSGQPALIMIRFRFLKLAGPAPRGAGPANFKRAFYTDLYCPRKQLAVPSSHHQYMVIRSLMYVMSWCRLGKPSIPRRFRRCGVGSRR